MILAGMMGAGSLVGAVDCWIEGVKPEVLTPTSFGITAYFLLVTIGLLLVAVESAKSGGLAWPTDATAAPGRAARAFVLGRWWKSFCLVLLLAISPAVLALALATARRAPIYEPHFTTGPTGGQVIDSYVQVNAQVPTVGYIRLAQRLRITALLIVTILVHGGAAVSFGLGVSVASKWSEKVLATVIGLASVTLLVLHPMNSLFAMLISRSSLSFEETLWYVTIWNMVVAAFAVALSRWTIRAWQRRLTGASQPLLSKELKNSPSAMATIFIGD
jgi:hypothetical protein